MTTNLKQRVDAVMSLNEKRTQDEWHWNMDLPDGQVFTYEKGLIASVPWAQLKLDALGEQSFTAPNTEFIANSPEMMSIITDLMAINKQMADGFKKISEEGFYDAANKTDDLVIILDEHKDLADSMLQSYHQHGFGE